MATSTPAGEFVSGPHIGRIVTLTSQLQTVGSSSSSSERCARQRYVGKFGFMDQHDVAGIDRDIYFRYDDVTTRYVHELRRGMFFEFSLWRYSDHPKWGLRAHLLHPAKLPKSASRLPSPKSKTKKKAPHTRPCAQSSRAVVN